MKPLRKKIYTTSGAIKDGISVDGEVRNRKGLKRLIEKRSRAMSRKIIRKEIACGE